MTDDDRYITGKRKNTHRSNDEQQIETLLPSEKHNCWKENIELFFDAQRPEMEQRLLIGELVEISRVIPKKNVRQVAGGRSDVSAEAFKIRWKQRAPPHHPDCNKNQ